MALAILDAEVVHRLRTFLGLPIHITAIQAADEHKIWHSFRSAPLTLPISIVISICRNAKVPFSIIVAKTNTMGQVAEIEAVG